MVKFFELWPWGAGLGLKIGRKWGKISENWYYSKFDPKKYIKNYKMRVISKKECKISHYQLGKKSRDATK